MRRPGTAWALLGLGACVLIAVTGPRLAGHGPTGWWFAPRIPGARAEFYVGLAALSLSWLALGPHVTRHGASVGQLRLIGAAWCAPLLAGPVLFSHDVYSYLAQGEILRLGLNPYHVVPSVLGPLGHQHFLNAVSPFWRGTTAPYGPLFLGAVELIVSVTGTHLIAGVLLVRGLDLAGLILLAVFVPRLARATGADPLRATWLTVLSPLVLLELIAAGHNDALMVGLLVAAVTLAVERRPLVAILLCALAATVKLPAAAGIVLIGAAWAASRRDRLGALVQTVLGAGAVALVIGAVTGVGLSWLSASLISTPQKVHLAITPSTALGYTAAAVLRDAGVVVNAHHLESALGVAALGFTALAGLAIAGRARLRTLPRDLGVVLLIAALCGPAAWPWYLTWSLVLLAAWPATRSQPALTFGLPVITVVSVFVVKPDGILALPLQSAPVVVAVYAVVAGAGGYVLVRSRRRSTPDPGAAGPEPVPARPRPPLVGSR